MDSGDWGLNTHDILDLQARAGTLYRMRAGEDVARFKTLKLYTTILKGYGYGYRGTPNGLSLEFRITVHEGEAKPYISWVNDYKVVLMTAPLELNARKYKRTVRVEVAGLLYTLHGVFPKELKVLRPGEYAERYSEGNMMKGDMFEYSFSVDYMDPEREVEL